MGHLNLCLCLSVLPGFLSSNSVARTVVDRLGPGGARDYFTKLVSRISLTRSHRYNYNFLICHRSKATTTSSNVTTRPTPLPSAVFSVLVTSSAGTVTLVPPAPTLPSASAGRPTPSVMVCVGLSLADAARRVSPGLSVISLLGLLVRPCVGSPAVEMVLIMLTPTLTWRVVSAFSWVTASGG